MSVNIKNKPKEQSLKNESNAIIMDHPFSKRNYILLGSILLLSFIAYYPIMQNGFVWDDEFYIQKNPLLLSFNLKEIFTQNVLCNYHPLTVLMLATEYHFFGLNETGYHAVNLIIHLLNVVLVFQAIFLLSEKIEVALVASLLFGIHPMHVESVAWAAELKDLLYTFFFLASYIFYMKFMKDPLKKYYVFALLLFSASMLSKAMAASLPVLFILTDYFKGKKIDIKSIIEKLPFLILSIVLGIIAIKAQATSGAIDIAPYPFIQRIVFACEGFITYLFKLVLPINQSAYYPFPISHGESIPVQHYIYVLLVLGLVAFTFYSLRFSKKIIFGLGFFSITVFLVLQLLPVGGAMMADRYSYIPSIGIFYLAGEGFLFLYSKKTSMIPVIALSVLTIFFTVKTYARCAVWENSMTLWNDVIDQYQTIPVAYHNRGLEFYYEKKYDEAVNDFNKAIQLKPDYVDAYINLGNIFENLNQPEKALQSYSKVIQLKPEYPGAYYNRGSLYMNQKKYDEALKDFNKSIELNPNVVEGFYNRGALFMDLGKNNEAISDFQKAVTIDPNCFDAYFNMAFTFNTEKRYEESIANYSKALSLKPNDVQTIYNRGLAEFSAGKIDASCNDMKQALNLGAQISPEIMQQICH